MLASPCYDRLTKTDCPLRAIYCKSTCQRWKAYEAQKQAEYTMRLTQAEQAQANIYYNKHRMDQMKRRKNSR